MALLEADRWTGQIFVNGWKPGGRAATTPSSSRRPAPSSAAWGRRRRRTLHAAAASAAEAQRDVGRRRGYQERAAILRKAGDLWNEHARRHPWWIMRETGAIPPKAQLELWFAASDVLRGGRR